MRSLRAKTAWIIAPQTSPASRDTGDERRTETDGLALFLRAGSRWRRKRFSGAPTPTTYHPSATLTTLEPRPTMLAYLNFRRREAWAVRRTALRDATG